MRINKRRKLRLLKGEKLLYLAAIILVLMSPLITVYNKGKLSQVDIEIEKLRRQISTQEQRNQSLLMKINELASLENIQSVAQNMGLSYNNNNIRMIAE
ncbi:MAG: cell division protein FtsL [Bacilli bacterium]|nr:cell division protein FtsL [Bacilli bacterium]